MITTGPRLLIEVRESASKKLLEHGDQYLSTLMTGGEVLWVDCGDPYVRQSAQFSPPDAGSCDDAPPGCAFPDPLATTAKLTLHCVKRE